MPALTALFTGIRFIGNVADKPDYRLNTSETSFRKSECLSELYRFKILTEEDWLQYKQLFDKVYPGFINQLRTMFPGLAAGEERQVMFTKLNMNSKECANMLGITVDSVKKNRYRLKKKFSLSKADDLNDYVRSI